MNAVATAAERPTIAFGLRRIVLKAPSKKSPSVSGRSATTPGLCTGAPAYIPAYIPGPGCWG